MAARGRWIPEERPPWSFDVLRDVFREPGLMLWRPYPPHRGPAGRSRIGGFPDMPAGVSWPRTGPWGTINASNTPLHFMAQIDLAEMPWLPDAMPRDGTLLFFGRVDEDLLWGDSIYPSDAVRVIYDPASAGVPMAPPDDKAPIMGGYSGYDRDFSLRGQAKMRSYPAWALSAAKVDTLPQWSAVREYLARQVPPPATNDEAREQALARTGSLPGWNAMPDRHDSRMCSDDYKSAQARFAAEQAAGRQMMTLLPPPDEPVSGMGSMYPIYTEASSGPRVLKPHAESGYPWCNLIISLTLKGIRKWREDERGYVDPTPVAAAINRLGEGALADKLGEPVGAEMGGNFVALINLMLTSVDLRQQSRIGLIIDQAIRQAVIQAGGDRGLAATLPDAVYAASIAQHQVISWQNGYPERLPKVPRARHHQMFGHVRASQTAKAIDNEDICLLQLVSDFGSDLMLCDMGEANFWIKPDDLAAGRWDKVWGTTEGD